MESDIMGVIDRGINEVGVFLASGVGVLIEMVVGNRGWACESVALTAIVAACNDHLVSVFSVDINPPVLSLVR